MTRAMLLVLLAGIVLAGCSSAPTTRDVTVYVLDDGHAGSRVNVTLAESGYANASTLLTTTSAGASPNVGGPAHVATHGGHAVVSAVDAVGGHVASVELDIRQTPYVLVIVRATGLEIQTSDRPPNFL